jgi:hypothetical protein
MKIKKSTSKLLLLLFFIFSTLLLNAQVVIKANDKSIRYDLIKSSHYFQKVTSYDSLGDIKYEFMNESIIKADSANGKIIFSRTRQIPYGRLFSDSSIISYSGPVSYMMSSNPMIKRLDVKFNVKSVETNATIKGIKSNLTTKMNEGYFDDNIVEDILGFISFEKGIKYHLDSYRYESKDGQNPYDIEYVLDDILQYPYGNAINCSVLHVVNGYSNAYVWIDKATHTNIKEVIQSKTSMVVVLTL